MLERVHQKQIHKHVLGTWLEESYASGKPRSINDAIRYCSLHIDGFTDKKIRSQRAWVSRAIRSLDLDEYISRSKPATSGAAKKPKMVMLSPSPTSLEDIEREVSEILAQMHDEAFLSSSTDSCGDQHEWAKCVEGASSMYTPVRVDHASRDAECLAANHKDDCMWTSHDECEDIRRAASPSAKTVSCGGGLKRRRATKRTVDDPRRWCAVALTPTAPRAFQCYMVMSSSLHERMYIASRTSEDGAMECVWNDNTCTSKASLEDCRIWLVTVDDHSAVKVHEVPNALRSSLANGAVHLHARRRRLDIPLYLSVTTLMPRVNAMSSTLPPTTLPPEVSTSDSMVMAISISVACVVLAAWIGFLLYRRRQQTVYEHHLENFERASNVSYAHMMDTTPAPPLNLSYLEVYRIDSQYITLTSILGSGGYADVYLGSFGGQDVAVKTMFQNHPTRRELAAFADEIQILAMLHSPFVVEFVGASWDDGAVEGLQCVMEYMDRGDLKEVLSMYEPALFPWTEKLHCIQSIAEGLAYLHAFPIIHRDLKSRNVLLDSAKGTKLTDFGGSREETTSTMTAGVGTYRWMAPEVLLSHRYTTAADVYSFGMLLTEFDTHDIPFVHLKAKDSGKPLPDVTIVGMLITNAVEISFSTAMPQWLAALGRRCVSRDPLHRPTTAEITDRLRANMQF
ncbi:hypothetical protein DYB37_005910 [Aphanomyces astaci]|uniref:Protein kinase domain-containing protein n=1 Tax=Aphanomyces astaci TaxID=112090 RepID=A0A3R6X8R2_APHAT|nr:hypothetical protein DYB35_005734 [Aphanomyces astaci]RHZ03395.1 hypothetical protein DYB37_005910 [Aphanomyces astaci]